MFTITREFRTDGTRIYVRESEEDTADGFHSADDIELDEGDLRYLAMAGNMHEEMLAALKMALETIDRVAPPSRDDIPSYLQSTWASATQDAIRAAIAKAERRS